MAALFNVGSKVKVEIDGLPYSGIIITYDESVNPVTYKISTFGLDQVATVEESDIELLTAESINSISTNLELLASYNTPYPLILTQGADTTLTVTLTHMGLVELATPIVLASGDELYRGDKFTVTVVGGTVAVTGATEISTGLYKVDSGVIVTSIASGE